MGCFFACKLEPLGGDELCIFPENDCFRFCVHRFWDKCFEKTTISKICHASPIIAGESKMSVYFYFMFHIQVFFLVKFRYVANIFYLKLGESSYCA